MKSRSQLARFATVLSLLFALSLPRLTATEAEDELKSATLLAFVRNAHWAESPAASVPLTVGVVGRPEFFRWLSASTEGKTVNGRPLRILDMNAPVDQQCCQVLYFATDKPAQIKPVLQSVISAHVLTVGETDSFLELGGAVNLFLMDGHMAFEVSLGALDRARIEISSKLLRFGQIRERGKGRPAQ